jgi:hypothetical protein
MGKPLFGQYYVKPTASAIGDAQDLFPRYGDYQEARRHALKLAFWPDSGDADEGMVEDLNWEWIRSLRKLRIGELRIDDVIGGKRNLRIPFWVSDQKLPSDPMPRIWTLAVVDKKNNDWTPRELEAFADRLTSLKIRFYE